MRTVPSYRSTVGIELRGICAWWSSRSTYPSKTPWVAAGCFIPVDLLEHHCDYRAILGRYSIGAIQHFNQNEFVDIPAVRANIRRSVGGVRRAGK
jgi:hypothetical protein